MDLQYFRDTGHTIPRGVGFRLFDATYFGWLLFAAVLCTVMVRRYRRMGEKTRRRTPLIPTRRPTPLLNFMHLHSAAIHLLPLFPLLLPAGKRRPNRRLLPKCLGVLGAMALPICFINKLLGANLMFINWAEAGTPPTFFESFLGTPGCIRGIPALLAVSWFFMYPPWAPADRRWAGAASES